jgi:cell division transport system permease protein
MSINLGYFASESVQNFRRNWVMSLGAVVTIFLSLLLVGVFLTMSVIVGGIVKSVESKVAIQVFIKDGVSTSDVDALQQWLVSDQLVQHVEYTSKEKALDKFKQDMKSSPEIIQQLEGNPLPASLDVQLKDPHQVVNMVAKIKANPTFLKIADRPDDPEQSLKYGQQTVQKLFAFTNVIRWVGIAFVLLLAAVSLIFINNTIRLAIYARRKEIGIMRLVGASNWFIRTPFLLEGVIQALIGALLAILVIVMLQALVVPRLGDALPFLQMSATGGATAQIAITLVLAGVFIGLLGSTLALRRYLKV